jgi:ferric enterobactin receptor
MRILLLIFLILNAGCVVMAQFTIRGKVTTLQNSALPYVYVSLKSIDSLQRINTVTDSAGNYMFHQVPSGIYTLSFQFIGFKPFFLNKLFIEKDMDIHVVRLEENLTLLNEVTVIGEKTFIESGTGKFTLHVGQDIASAGGTVMDGLARMPAVETNPQGQVLVRGSRNVKIFINGRETKKNTTTLNQIPLELIEKVELITAPSARYSAEGTAGIINIIYKKGSTQDLKIQGSAFAAWPARYQTGLNFNHRINDRWSYFVNTNLIYAKGRSRNVTQRTSQEQQEKFRDFQSESKGVSDSYYPEVMFGFQFKPDTTSETGIDVNINGGPGNNSLKQRNVFFSTDESAKEYTLNNESRESEAEFSVSVNYQKKFNARTGNIQFVYSIEGENEKNYERFNTQQVDLSESPLLSGAKMTSANEVQRIHEWRLDYTKPLAEYLFTEAGVKIDLVNYEVAQHIELYRPETLPDVNFNMEQIKYAGYALIRSKGKKFDFEAGLRWEDFRSSTSGRNPDTVFQVNNSRLFPSASIQYQLPGSRLKQSFGISYGMRINRPGFFSLYPYVNYTNPLNLTSGNPYLQPELAHALEGTHRIEANKITVQSTLYYRKIKNGIQNVIELINDSVSLVLPKNFSSANTIGFESLMTIEVLSWLNFILTPSASINNFQSINNDIIFNNQLTWRIRCEQEIKLGGRIKIQLTEQYRSATIGPRIRYEPQYFINAGMQYTPVKKMVFILNVSDIFDINQNKYSTDGNGFRINSLNKFQTRRIQLGLRYTFK